MADYIPNSDQDFQTWLNNLVTILTANQAAFGLIVGDINSITTKQSTYNTALTDVTTKRQAYDAAVTFKNTSRADAVATVRYLKKKVDASAATGTLRTQAGLPVHDAEPTPSTPTTPTGVKAVAHPSGTNTVTWKRSGNSHNILFVVEAKVGSAADWSEIYTTNLTTFDHENQTPGVQVKYRVRARKKKTYSEPSEEVVVYG